MKKHRIVIVDDHPVVRVGLTELIESEADMELSGESSSAEDAWEKIRELRPHVAVVDISLGGRSGIDLAQKIQKSGSGTRVLIMSMHEDALFAERALRAGAWGYVHKQEPPEKVLEAIYSVLDGKVYISPAILERILQRRTASDHLSPFPLESLSNREIQVFQLIGQGFNTQQIARKLTLSVKTVEAHRTHIKRKMGFQSNTELVQQAALWLHTELGD